MIGISQTQLFPSLGMKKTEIMI